MDTWTSRARRTPDLGRAAVDVVADAQCIQKHTLEPRAVHDLRARVEGRHDLRRELGELLRERERACVRMCVVRYVYINVASSQFRSFEKTQRGRTP